MEGSCLCCSLQGHLLLIGVSGAGKTTLSRFVAWINGLSVFQVKVSSLTPCSLSSMCLVRSPLPFLIVFLSLSLSLSLPLPLQVHRKYTAADFDDDLRMVLRRSGCRDEKIVLIMDESNVLESSFLERMNTLLANGEVCVCLSMYQYRY